MGKFWSTQLQNHVTDFDEIRTLELPPEGDPPCNILFWSDNVGGLGEYPVYHCHWKDNLRSLFPQVS